MERKRGREFINNIIFILIGIVTALFMVFYEYHAIGEYASTLEQEEARSFGVAMIIVFIFAYVMCAVALVALSAVLCALTMVFKKEPLRVEGSLLERKKQLITIIVLKVIAAAIVVFMLLLSFDAAYATILSKLFYCIVTAFAFASIAHSGYSLYKMTTQK